MSESAKRVERIVLSLWSTEIRKDARRCSTLCPIACAFRRRFPKATLEGIAPCSIWVDFNDGWGKQVIKLTLAAREWIKRFDAGEPAAAGPLHTFDL